MNAVLVAILMILLQKAPATQPTTAPTSQPAMESLWEGRIHFEPPEGWVLVSKTPDGLQAHYRSPDHLHSISVVVTPQNQILSESMVRQLSVQLIQKIKESAQKTGTTLLYGPRAETDERFMMSVHDRYRGSSGSGDRMQRYKQKGFALVLVVSLAQTEDPKEGNVIHAEAAKLLENVVLTRGNPKPPATRPSRTR